jgi:hypothetical protein
MKLQRFPTETGWLRAGNFLRVSGAAAAATNVPSLRAAEARNIESNATSTSNGENSNIHTCTHTYIFRIRTSSMFHLLVAATQTNQNPVVPYK